MASPTTSSLAPNGNFKPQGLCQECKATAFRYVCPRCAFKSCSLACCKAHKHRLSCNGQRDRTAYSRLSRMSDATLQSDYHFLEDVVQQMERGKRILGSDSSSKRPPPKRPRRPWEVGGNYNQQEEPPHPLLQAAQQQHQQSNTLAVASSTLKLPNDLAPRLRKVAQTAATSDNTRVLFGPAGLQRRLLNKSYVCRNSNVVHWTVEWLIYDEINATPSTRRLYTSVPATTTLTQALSEASVVPSSTNNAVLLIRQFPQTTYAQLSKDSTLQEALSGRTVMEFPTLHLVPLSRMSEFKLTVQEVVVDEKKESKEETTAANATAFAAKEG